MARSFQLLICWFWFFFSHITIENEILMKRQIQSRLPVSAVHVLVLAYHETGLKQIYKEINRTQWLLPTKISQPLPKYQFCSF